MAAYEEDLYLRLSRHFVKESLGIRGCWQWTGKVDHYGYARTNVRGTPLKAGRVMYELIFGSPILDGLVLDHLCRNRRCVNPFHLDAISQSENSKRRWASITHCNRGHPYPDGVRTCAECAAGR